MKCVYHLHEKTTPSTSPIWPMYQRDYFSCFSVIDDNNDPEWDAKFYFPFVPSSESEVSLEITLEIYDHDPMKIDDHLGSVTATIPKDAEKGAISYPVAGRDKTGTVLIQFFKMGMICYDT